MGYVHQALRTLEARRAQLIPQTTSGNQLHFPERQGIL
jgi:hypothetical protein